MRVSVNAPMKGAPDKAPAMAKRADERAIDAPEAAPDKALAAAFRRACRADIEALKPGNVGVHGDGHGMHWRDFIESADACAGPLCRPQDTLGGRILSAIEATRRAVGHNTNLGIVLLCAPLVQAAFQRKPEQLLRDAVADVLDRTTVADAALAYRAIRLAGAGGLGRVERLDVGADPDAPLRETMREACRRDRIAAQYINDYREVFDYALPLLLEFRSKWGHNHWPAAGVYLTLLAEYPDSLVDRKHGARKAAVISREVAPLQSQFVRSREPEKFRRRFLALDVSLKQKGLNPGTTADLTVAGVFAAELEQLIAVASTQTKK